MLKRLVLPGCDEHALLTRDFKSKKGRNIDNTLLLSLLSKDSVFQSKSIVPKVKL